MTGRGMGMTRRATRQPRPARQAPPTADHAARWQDAEPQGDLGADLDAYVAELVAAAPPLTSDQRDRLALLLRAPQRR
jgi:hypothetical protein